jgi:hypothetical protein
MAASLELDDVAKFLGALKATDGLTLTVGRVRRSP